ncbi:MAG: glucose-1-phosphate adenylyltransferase [Bryobacteraceae bacterium]
MERVLAILLAGGAGERLFPLTQNTAKPAVPFGGAYRIIDVTLSNCINSNVRRIFILTQYKALELNRHIREGWRILSPELGEFIELVPPMKRMRDDWYLGTADAVYQNIPSIVSEGREYTLILSGDHIYKMDYADMLDWHLSRRADVTIATIQVPREQSDRFGVATINKDCQVVGFQEKPRPEAAAPSTFNPAMISASMGVYLFSTPLLVRALLEDAEDPASSHDFGHDILPKWLSKARIIAYDFRDLNDKKVSYWRDVGTLDAYYEANMDLVAVTPEFNLYDRGWPIRTRQLQNPPAKFVFAQEGRRMGIALDSIVSAGCIVSGGRVIRSVLSPGVRVNSYCEVDSSILLNDVEVGRYSRIRKAIVDAGVKVPEGSLIGYDLEQDRANGFHVTEGGVVVVPCAKETYATIAV